MEIIFRRNITFILLLFYFVYFTYMVCINWSKKKVYYNLKSFLFNKIKLCDKIFSVCKAIHDNLGGVWLLADQPFFGCSSIFGVWSFNVDLLQNAEIETQHFKVAFWEFSPKRPHLKIIRIILMEAPIKEPPFPILRHWAPLYRGALRPLLPSISMWDSSHIKGEPAQAGSPFSLFFFVF